jgi:hypothetical protein
MFIFALVLIGFGNTVIGHDNIAAIITECTNHFVWMNYGHGHLLHPLYTIIHTVDLHFYSFIVNNAYFQGVVNAISNKTTNH